MTNPSPSVGYCLVLVTAASESEARSMARILVAEKLAACVSLMPVQSIYRWQGQIQEASEWQMVIKTKQEVFDALQNRVVALHSYDVPEILAVPILAGSNLYLEWIESNVGL